MLDGLDAIDWPALTHAYGSAADVPGQLRALRSPSAEERDAALQALFGNIFHQESVYDSSAAAAPFLIELAAARDTANRPDILHLLSALAVGYDEHVLPEGIPTGRRRGRPVYDAVADGVPVFRALLADGDPQVEMQAARLLAWFPDDAEASLVALEARLDADPPGWTAATLLVAVGLLGDPRQVPRLTAELRHAVPQRRHAAALALARIAPQPGTLEALVETTRADVGEARDAGFPFLYAELPGYAAHSFQQLPPGTYATAVDALAEALRRSDAHGGLAIVHGLLPLAFPEPVAGTAFGELAPVQQAALHGIAAAPWFVAGSGFGNVALLLSGCGLPGEHAGLTEYIAGGRRRWWRRR